MRLKTPVLAGLLLSSSLGQASTISPALGWADEYPFIMVMSFVDADKVLGWTFNVTAPITLNAMGRFDARLGPGFLVTFPPWEGDREVALWNSEGTLLASAFVAPEAPQEGFFRWAEISPVVLNPGNGYIIATPMPGIEFWTDNHRTGMTIHPAIEFGLAVEVVGLLLDPATFEYSYHHPDFAYFGPMFSILDASGPNPGAPIPEPGTWALMLGGWRPWRVFASADAALSRYAGPAVRIFARVNVIQ